VEICALVPSSLAGLLVQTRLLRYFSAHVLGLTIDGLGDMCHEALVTNGSRQRGDGRRWRLIVETRRVGPVPWAGLLFHIERYVAVAFAIGDIPKALSEHRLRRKGALFDRCY
jgi:hypothetical protein